MTTLDSTEIIALVFVVVLAIVVAGLLIYLIRRLKQRRAKILSELEDRPELNQDRAFNRLAMARREAAILAGAGVDVHRARELVAEAQGAFDTRQYDRAYRLAQSAHEALVTARQQGSKVAGGPLPSKGTGTPATPIPNPLPASPLSSPELRRPVPPAIPKNRAESQFQIRLLGDELAALQGRRASDPSVTEAKTLRTQASAAFDKGDYTDAFRTALRGRRTLGGTVESLPAASGTSAGFARAAADGKPAATDPAQSAEAVAGGERCPDCGYPALPGDVFCRGCGRPHAPLTCPSCGATRVGSESYCGRCGARFP